MALNTFVAEVTLHDGKVEQHGIGVGGVPNMSAEDVADHLVKLDHFQGKAAKIVIKHRSAPVKRDISTIHKTKAAELKPVVVEVHPDANSDTSNLHEPSLQKATPAPSVEGEAALLEQPVK